MNYAERLYKAKRKQGKLTSEQIEKLRSDLLPVLDSNFRSEKDIIWKLVRNHGWKKEKLFGPRKYVRNCLERLDDEGLVELKNVAPKGCWDLMLVYKIKEKSRIPLLDLAEKEL